MMNPNGVWFSPARLAAFLIAIAITTALPVRADPAPVFFGKDGEFTRIDPAIPVPDEIFALEPDQTRTLASFRPRLLLVNFWASWCEPCLREMPALDRLEKDLGPLGFSVVAIAIDRQGAAKALPFYRRLGILHLDLYTDRESRLYRAMGDKVRGKGSGSGALPESFLIDRKGRIVAHLIGPADWDSPDARAFLRYYIDLPWL